MQPMGVGNMRRGGIGGLRGNLRQGLNPMQMGMQAPQGMMPPQQFAMPQDRGAMRQGFNPMQTGMMAPAAMTLASPMQPRPQDIGGMGMPLQQMMPQEQALQARRLAPQQFGPMGGPGFAQPLSPPPSQQQMLGGPQQQGGQAMGGAKWTMEIKPAEGMATGGMIEGGGFNVPQPRIPEEFTEGVEVLNFDSTAPLPELENPNMMTGADIPVPDMQETNELLDLIDGTLDSGMDTTSELMGEAALSEPAIEIEDPMMQEMPMGGIAQLNMAGGGYVPMVYANGGYIPAYGLGGFFKKVAKGALKLAPVAAMAIPGIGPLASGAIGGLAGTLSAKLEGQDFGSALSRGLSTGIKSYAGSKAIGGFKDAFNEGEGSFLERLEGGLGGLKGAFSTEDILKMAPMLAQAEAMDQGHAGGAGGDMTATTLMPGGGGGRPSGAMPGTITQVEAPTAARYNLFDQIAADAGQARAGGGPVGSLYAMRRFGGGEIDGYRIGGRVSKRGRRGRRGRGRGRESSRPRRSPRKNVRPPTRAPVQRAQPVAPPPPPMMAAPDMMPAIPDVMPVAPPPPPARPAPVRAPAPPPPMAPAIEDMIPETVSASPVRAPERPKAPPVNRPMAAFPDAIGIEDDGPPMMPQPAAPRAPRKMSPERERPVDIPVVGGFIPSPEGEPAPVAPEIEEILPATTGRGEERRRSRRGREGGEGSGRMGSEGGGERREEKRSRDSGRRGEEGGELGGERGETTSGRANIEYSYEEGGGDRQTEEQKRMAEKFATKDPESMLTSGPDESSEMENIRAIAQGKPADDIVSIEGTMIEPENVNDPTPPSIVGYQNPALLAQRDAQLMATPVTYQRPPPPPPPPVVQGTGLGLGGGSGTPAEAAPINMFGSGASPSDMRTEADQFAESNPRMAAMLARMDAEEAPLETYVPEPEGKAEGGFLAEMQQDETGMQILEAVAMALQDPQDDDNAQTIQSFQEAFGDEALAEVAQMLQAGAQQEMMAMDQPTMAPPLARQRGGLVPGAGDAMVDDKLGVVDQGEPTAYPIKFSSGEFLMAGDVVAGLGSGNTERGAAVLNQLQDDVRMARNGTTQQAPPIDLSEVLPGTYGEQYG